MDDAHEQQLFSVAPVEHAKLTGGELPESGSKPMQFLDLMEGQLPFSQPKDVGFDALAESIGNMQEVAFGVAGKDDVKRSWFSAHAPGIGSNSPCGRPAHRLRLRRSDGGMRGCIPS